jgi:hypothetical protein
VHGTGSELCVMVSHDIITAEASSSAARMLVGQYIEIGIYP